MEDMGKDKKEPFNFKYIRPCLDWFDTKEVIINDDDYYYFKIQRRFGPSWWLIGSNPPKDRNKYKWSETELGEIYEYDLKRFIEWAKNKDGSSRITEINAICGSFNIIDEITKLQQK